MDKIKFIGLYLLNISLIIITIYFIGVFLYSCFPHKMEITLNSKYRNDLKEFLAREYDEPQKITKLKITALLGDGKLELYSNGKKLKEIRNYRRR